MPDGYPNWADIERRLIDEQVGGRAPVPEYQGGRSIGPDGPRSAADGPQQRIQQSRPSVQGWALTNPEAVAQRRAQMMEMLAQYLGNINPDSPQVREILYGPQGTLQHRLDRVEMAGLKGQSLEAAARRRADMRAGGGYEAEAVDNKAEAAARQRETTRNNTIQEAMNEVSRSFLDQAQELGLSVDPQLALADAADRRAAIDAMYEDQALMALMRIGGYGIGALTAPQYPTGYRAPVEYIDGMEGFWDPA